jgi:hypothetical protein|uniref:Uncharacterized protein n=1 Tax=Myoviridae sp. ctByu2 TaxID=2827668 RepID=A0A8S5S9G2_9CAUD|nr:MAG TPA: hypothetical protein [Myoviridae sp. ctByu2]
MVKFYRYIDGYRIKKQQHGLFKVIEYSSLVDGTSLRKRTLFKDLTISDAEDHVYKLETKNANRLKRNIT